MKKFAIIVAAFALVGAGIVLVATSTSQASQPIAKTAPQAQNSLKNHLSINGAAVAGVVSVNSGQDLAFDFTVKNHGRTAEPGDVFYTWSNAKYVDIICPLVSSGADIGPDSPACEPGELAPGGSTQSAIVLKLNGSSGPIVVTGCATEENSEVPPQCATLSIPVNP